MNFHHYYYGRALSKRLSIVVSAIAFALAMPPKNAQADIIISANSTSNLGNGSPAQQGTSGTVSDTGGGTLGTDTTTSRSSATHGQLKAYASIIDGIGGTTNGTWAWSRTDFRDNFLINKEGLTGTSGTVEMKFKIDGTLFATRSANTNDYQPGSDDAVRAFAEYTFSPGLNRDTHRKFQALRTVQYAAAMGSSRHEGTAFLGLEQSYIVPFTYGTTLESVGLSLFVGAEGSGYDQGVGFTSSAIADLEHTANWIGFGAVRDAGGNIVGDYTFSSGSGFNYVQGITAVPEPSSCVLLLSASGLAFLRRNRSRQLA